MNLHAHTHLTLTWCMRKPRLLETWNTAWWYFVTYTVSSRTDHASTESDQIYLAMVTMMAIKMVIMMMIMIVIMAITLRGANEGESSAEVRAQDWDQAEG